MSARTSKMEWYPQMPGAEYVEVYLDGKKVEYCVSANCAAEPGIEVDGKVAFYEADKETGTILLFGDYQDPRVLTEKGMVRWEWTNEEIPWEIWKNSI